MAIILLNGQIKIQNQEHIFISQNFVRTWKNYIKAVGVDSRDKFLKIQKNPMKARRGVVDTNFGTHSLHYLHFLKTGQ